MRNRYDTDDHDSLALSASHAATGKSLALVSIGIGLTEILASRQLLNVMGVKETPQHQGVMRLLGVREICHGLDLLTHKDASTGIKARIAGDVLDSALLGVAATKTTKPGGLAAVFAAVLPVVILDVVFGALLPKRRDR